MVYSWGGGEHGQVRGRAILPLLSIVESALHKTHEALAPCMAHADPGVPYVYSRMGCMPASHPPQLGHSDKINRTAPCAVEALGGKAVVYVACGWSHSVFLGGDGRVSNACVYVCVRGGMHGCLRIVRTCVCGPVGTAGRSAECGSCRASDHAGLHVRQCRPWEAGTSPMTPSTSTPSACLP
jgi:alpha-tubulin suppressor-like RCC1 family protein